jgi:deoxyhypusine synthase
MLVPNENYCLFEDWIVPILDQMLKEQQEEVGARPATLACHADCKSLEASRPYTSALLRLQQSRTERISLFRACIITRISEEILSASGWWVSCEER